MDALTTTDADATTLSGLSYFCAAVADAAETTTETAVAASKSKSNLTTHLGTTKTGGYDASGSFCLLLIYEINFS